MEKNYFSELNAVNVNDKTEKKGKLTYLSWAWAWAELKRHYPESTYTVYEAADGCVYHTDGRTAWVKTGVTVQGIEHIEYLPIMDSRNASIPLERITSFNANTAIQRSLTKAVARHGLGLYIYAGEDLPDGDGGDIPDETPRRNDPAPARRVEKKPEFLTPNLGADPTDSIIKCAECHEDITPTEAGGVEYTAEKIASLSQKQYGRPLCWDCAMKARNAG